MPYMILKNKKRINTFETLTGLQLPVSGVNSDIILRNNSETVKKNINTEPSAVLPDLTEPKERNTPGRINGLASPVGNLIRKGVSNDSIPTAPETVKKNINTAPSAVSPNVGNIEEDELPSAKLIAVVGSKPLGNSSSAISISSKPETVKEKNIELRDRALKNGLDILSVVKKRPFRARLISYLKDFLSPFLYLFRLW